MTCEQEFNFEISPELAKATQAVNRIKITFEAKGVEAQKIVEEEFRNLVKLYESSDSAVRAKVITGVSALPIARQLLVKAIQTDSSELNRHEAAFGLGLTEAKEFVPVLIEFGVNDVDPTVRHESVIALGTIGDASALPAIEELLYFETIYGVNSIVIKSCKIAIADIKCKVLTKF